MSKCPFGMKAMGSGSELACECYHCQFDAARAEAAALREALDALQIAFADAESAARRINIGCACGDCISAYDELRAALDAAKR